MNPDHTALGEPHLWTQVEQNGRQTSAQHPNGAVLTVIGQKHVWCVSGRRPATDTWSGIYQVAEIPRTPAGMVEDILRVTGPEPRARLDRLLLDIQVWATEIPGHSHEMALNRCEGLAIPSPAIGMCPLPIGLRARLRALDFVLHPDSFALRMDTRSPTKMDLPRTAHGILALRAARLDR